MSRWCSAIFLLWIPLHAGSISRTVDYSPSGIDFREMSTFWVLEAAGMQQRGIPGTPLLPSSSEVFVLPEGATNVSFSVRPISTAEVVHSGLQIAPAPELRPIGSPDPQVVVENPEVYSSDDPWPVSPLISSHTGDLSGVPVASCLVQPWIYLPRSGSLRMITEMEITVSWDDGPSSSLTCDQRLVRDIRTAALTGSMNAGNVTDIHWDGGGDAQYLIVCDSAYVDVLKPLADFHAGQGMSVSTVDIQYVLSNYQGSDDAERLRNFIRDMYLNHGTVYVLLAGDESLLPVRMIYLYCEGYGDTAPVDLYFADLDGTWDGNGDGKYGQPDDDLDLYADVVLARGLFSTPEEAETFVQKSLAYQEYTPPGQWSARAVLCGAVLFPEQGYTSDRGCDSIAVEFPGYWEVNKFYEELSGGGFTQHIPVLQSGSAWNHYAGHGNTNGIWWNSPPLAMMTTWIASDSLQNGDRSGIHTSIACHPARYIGDECCAEALLHNPDGGAAAVLFNVSYGWEGFWPSLGASEWMCIDLARQVFRYHSPSLGLAFSTAKDLRIPFMQGGYDRTFQSLLSFSAFMDPAMKVLNATGPEPVPPVELTVSAPWPNPARRDAPVAFNVVFQDGQALVSVHDVSGRLIWSSDITSPGRVTWSGTDSAGRRVPAGVYVVSARRGDYIVSRLTTVLD